MKNIFLAAFMILSAVNVFPFKWPVKDPVLVASFGENIHGSFSKGIELQSPDDEVRSISSGEIVFYHDRADGEGLPSPLGNYTVIRHDRGIYSLYSHLSDVYTDDFTVSEGSAVGTIGATGVSSGKVLFLMILDSEFEQFINPLLSLPPLADTVRPHIGKISFSKEGSGTESEPDTVLEKGRYVIRAEIKDFSVNPGYYCPVAPYSINLYINGENKKSIRFESLQVGSGKIVLSNSGGMGCGDIYDSRWVYNIGTFDFSPGDTRIEISVKDFEGNETSRIVSLKIAE